MGTFFFLARNEKHFTSFIVKNVFFIFCQFLFFFFRKWNKKHKSSWRKNKKQKCRWKTKLFDVLNSFWDQSSWKLYCEKFITNILKNNSFYEELFSIKKECDKKWTVIFNLINVEMYIIFIHFFIKFRIDWVYQLKQKS